jgi:glutathione S-transferase
VPPQSGLLEYTLPAIVHKTSISTNPSGALNDSLPIAVYLDEAFPAPQYPALFPSGDASYALVVAVEKIVRAAIMSKAFPLVLPNVAEFLDDKGKQYFQETRKVWFQKTLTELRPKNEEAAQSLREEFKEELSVFGEMLKGKKGKEGPFLEGSKPGYADLVIAANLGFFERADKETFEALLDVGDGAFRKLWDACLPWVNGQGEDREWAVPSL